MEYSHDNWYNKQGQARPQIVAKLRQADVLIGQDKTVPELCKELEISQQTYYRWRQKYGGISSDMIKQHRALQKENVRLRRVIADQALDIVILKEATKLRICVVKIDSTRPTSFSTRQQNAPVRQFQIP